MEFRVFLPVLKSRPTCASASLFDKYMNGIHLLIESISRSVEIETRTDTYIGGSNSFGLKYRDEKKLELKVKQNVVCSIPGVESFVKTKLGKAKLSSAKFVEKVLCELKELGNTDSSNAALLSSPDLAKNCCSICKSRIVNEFKEYDLIEELCRIENSNDGNANIAFWISVVYEGDLSKFFGSSVFVQLPHATIAWECLNIAAQIIQEASVGAQEAYNSIPVLIAGYPTFVNYLLLSSAAAQAQAQSNAVTDYTSVGDQLVHQVSAQLSTVREFLIYRDQFV